LDDFADKVVRRGDTSDGEVDAEFDTVGTASLGRKGFVEGGAAGLDEERCPVKPGMTAIDGGRFPVKPGMTLIAGWRQVIIVVFRVTLGEAGDKGEGHSCGRTRLRSSAREVL
jgi:hypothetical protein